MTARIQMRRDITGTGGTGWSSNPTLYAGEIGLDTTLGQIKIGSGATWSNTPWLGGTLPYFASPNTDIDHASNRIQGLYRFSTVTGMSGTLPAAPIDIKVADGGINMLVAVWGSIVVQSIWTDGDGNQPQKSYTRVYDGTYRSWIAQNVWGVANGEGVDLSANSLALKKTSSTALTVDGDVLMKANVTVGDASTDVLTVQAGTAALPSVAISGDTDTGIYSPTANKLGISAGGVSQVLFDNAVNSELAAVFRSGATFGNTVDMSAQKIVDLGEGNATTDAFRLGQLITNLVNPLTGNMRPLISIWARAGNSGATETTLDTSNLVTWTNKFGTSGAESTVDVSYGKWVGIVLLYNVGTLQSTFTIRVDSPLEAGTPKQMTTASITTRHIGFFVRVG